MREGDIGPRPKPGRYMSKRGEKCWVFISREATQTEDGGVRVEYDDGSFTAAFFRTFDCWRYQRLPESEQ